MVGFLFVFEHKFRWREWKKIKLTTTCLVDTLSTIVHVKSNKSKRRTFLLNSKPFEIDAAASALIQTESNSICYRVKRGRKLFWIWWWYIRYLPIYYTWKWKKIKNEFTKSVDDHLFLFCFVFIEKKERISRISRILFALNEILRHAIIKRACLALNNFWKITTIFISGNGITIHTVVKVHSLKNIWLAFLFMDNFF